MKKMISALASVLLAFTLFGAFNAAPASAAAVVTKSCDADGGANENFATVTYTHYLDGGGNWRARLDKVTVGHYYGSNRGVDYRAKFISDSGTAWDTGNSTYYFYNVYDIYPPSAANGRLVFNPKAVVSVGVNGDGYGMCTMTFNLY